MSTVRNKDAVGNEEDEGNKHIHENSMILDTHVHMTEAAVPLKTEHLAPTTVHLKKKDKEQEKDDKAKEELAMKVDHKIPLQELSSKYETNYEKGLPEEKAHELLHKYGENKLTEKKKTSIWVKLFKEMTGGFALMLWVGTGLCFLAYGLSLDDPSNLYLAIVLIIVILITTFITFQ